MLVLAIKSKFTLVYNTCNRERHPIWLTLYCIRIANDAVQIKT